MTAPPPLAYSPAVFNVGDINAAKRIILTPEGTRSTDERWRVETPYLLSLIGDSIELNERSLVLDYGCGIGRLSKELIGKYGCRAVGVDISPSMRALAASYVGSDRFFTCAPDALAWLGLSFDLALTVWVLQHCHKVEQDIARIHAALRPAGKLFVVNDHNRIVPTSQGWVNDGQDVKALLSASFTHAGGGDLDPAHIGGWIAKASYWATFDR